MINNIKNAFLGSLKPTFTVSMLMLKVFIPLSILTVLLKQFGVLDLLAPVFAPLMSIIGLPGEAAITLLVGFTNTIYASLATVSAIELTGRQITILGVVLGIAHSLFVETGILTNLRMATIGIALFRIVVAFTAGIVLNLIMPEIGGTVALAAAHQGEPFTWTGVLVQIGITSVQIVGIIFSITFGYELISLWKGADKFRERVSFIPSSLGISGKATAPWIVGFLVGITYGAALFYQFKEKQGLSHKDACLITVFICLAHAMIEDTVLFAVVGGSLTWIFVTRMIIAVLVVRLLAAGDLYRKCLWIGLPAEEKRLKA